MKGAMRKLFFFVVLIFELMQQMADGYCQNNERFKWNYAGKERTCNKIRNLESIRQQLCPITEVAANCPISCGHCCENNPFYQFTIENGEKKSCSWITENPGNAQYKKDKWCTKYIQNRMVRHACPKACDHCRSYIPLAPSAAPSTSQRPTASPSGRPSPSPSSSPTKSPSSSPSHPPTKQPSPSPSRAPSDQPSQHPSAEPSVQPSDQPSRTPSDKPSQLPSDQPSRSPSDQPSRSPSDQPSRTPSDKPSQLPSDQPSRSPSDQPSRSPSDQPSRTPSDQPSLTPSDQPSRSPSDQPSRSPSDQPSLTPSDQPSQVPSDQPSESPTECQDEPNWKVGGETDFAGMSCEEVGAQYLTEDWCKIISSHAHEYRNKNITDACCACNGSRFRTLVPSDSPSSEPTVSSSPTTESPSDTPSTSPSQCEDEPNWHFDILNEAGTGSVELNCLSVTNSNDPEALCERFKDIDYNSKSISLACCACGGGKLSSEIPSGKPSDKPSISPSDSPSKSPAPTKSPTKNPSVRPTETPSGSPSFGPTTSTSPTDFPSRTHNTVLNGDPCNYSAECRSEGVPIECIDKVCKTPSTYTRRRRVDQDLVYEGNNYAIRAFIDDKVPTSKFSNVVKDHFPTEDQDIRKDLNKHRRIQTDETNILAMIRGSQDMHPYSIHDQNVYGGTMDIVNDSIKVIGNAWKAYRLPQGYHITRRTWVRLTVELGSALTAEGVALCFDHVPIFSSSKRCLMLGGPYFEDEWSDDPPRGGIDFVHAKKVNLALGKPTEQSTTMYYLIGDSNKAVDGYVEPFWNAYGDIHMNSVTQTDFEEEGPWWRVDFAETNKQVSKIIIYRRRLYSESTNNCSYDDCRRGNFKVELIRFEGGVAWEGVFEDDDRNVIEFEIPHNENNGARVKISKLEAGILSLAEVVVIEKCEGTRTIDVNVPIGDMLDAQVNFGAPVWNGFLSDLAYGRILEDTTSYKQLDLGEDHLISHIIMFRVTEAAVHHFYLYVDNEDGEDGEDASELVEVFEITPSRPTDQNFYYVELPPNTIARYVRVDHGTDELNPYYESLHVIGNINTSDLLKFRTLPMVHHIGIIHDQENSDPASLNTDDYTIIQELQLYEMPNTDVELEIVSQFERIYATISIGGSEGEDLCFNRAGSYGNYLEQDFAGGGVIRKNDMDNSSVELFGNAWKAFELSNCESGVSGLEEAVIMTSSTRLQFTVEIVKEAEGHAICLDDDGIVDHSGGLEVRCIVISGTQFGLWATAKKHNLVWNKSAYVPGNNSQEVEASEAIDGNMNTVGVTDVADPWIKVNLSDTYIVTDIIIYPGKDDTTGLFDPGWDSFTVKVLSSDESVVWETQGGVGTILKFTNISQEGTGNPIIGSQVKFQFSGTFQLRVAEIEVFGKPQVGQSIAFDIPIGKMFLSSPSDPLSIRYLAFIQDNDAVPLYGKSIFSAIRLHQESPSQPPENFESHVTFPQQDCTQWCPKVAVTPDIMNDMVEIPDYIVERDWDDQGYSYLLVKRVDSVTGERVTVSPPLERYDRFRPHNEKPFIVPVTSGRCDGAGHSPIWSTTECKEAAFSLGFTVTEEWDREDLVAQDPLDIPQSSYRYELGEIDYIGLTDDETDHPGGCSVQGESLTSADVVKYGHPREYSSYPSCSSRFVCICKASVQDFQVISSPEHGLNIKVGFGQDNYFGDYLIPFHVETCHDSNAEKDELGICVCKDGYSVANAEGVLERYVGLLDRCDPTFTTRVLIDGDARAITIPAKRSYYHLEEEETAGLGRYGIRLYEGSDEAERNLQISTSMLQHPFQHFPEYDTELDIMGITLSNLKVGYRYRVEVRIIDSLMAKTHVIVPCSCNGDTGDRSGRPRDLVIYQQDGHVSFRFHDFSLCEEAFAFSRGNTLEEFLVDYSQTSVIFTSDLYHSAECGESIDSGTSASDNLQFSKLPVGQTYSYCVQAVKGRGHYMDSPYDASESSSPLHSSDRLCAPHTIRWEASIAGRVTTDKDAGHLPIRGVTVRYQLLSASLEELICADCSGNTTTSQSGDFHIHFNVDHPFLRGQNEDSLAVRIWYSKASRMPTVPDQEDPPGGHTFACPVGDDIEACDAEHGNLAFLKHLEFEKPLSIIDTSGIPFRGTIYIADTTNPASPRNGCVLANAKVCLFTRNLHTAEPDERVRLLCVKSGSDGTYAAPINVGSVIYEVRVDYHGHKFEQTTDNNLNYSDGFVIEEVAEYKGNDFRDVSKAELLVDIVGGECRHPLDWSQIRYNLPNCMAWGNDNEDNLKWHPTNQGSLAMRGNYLVPAHVIQVQVESVRNERDGDVTYEKVTDYFSSRFEIVDLTLEHIPAPAEDEEEALDQEVQADEERIGENSATQAAEQEESERKRLVTFYYEGDLQMSVVLTNHYENLLDCAQGSDLEAFFPLDSEAQSHYVVTSLADLEFRVDVGFLLIEETGLECHIAPDEYKVSLNNGIGVDNNSGADFDAATLIKLNKCAEGCSYEITHDEDEDGTKLGNAQVRFELTAGRPNIVEPFTKFAHFEVGAPNKQKKTHKAVFFIMGLYSKGPGNSFALPTHKPITIIRDPPGSESTASYENIRTEISVVNSNIQHYVGQYGKIGGTVNADFDGGICAGLGVTLCKKAVDAKVQAQAFAEERAGGYDKDETLEEQYSFSTTWSFTTSDDAEKAGPKSDVFVVPNLNVMYETFDVVLWDNERCMPAFDSTRSDRPIWPSTVMFDVAAPTSKPALAFYGRDNIETIKIPELEENINLINETLNRAQNDTNNEVCCDGEPPCTELSSGGLRECEESEIEDMRDQLEVLEIGLRGWEEALMIESNSWTDGKSSITEWFDDRGSIVIDPLSDTTRRGDRPESLGIDHHYSALAPKALMNNAESLGETYPGGAEPVDNLEGMKRVQIGGGGAIYEMHLSKEKIESLTNTDCWHGCNGLFEGSVGAQFIKQFGGGGASLRGEIMAALEVHYTHTSHKTESDEEATSISFQMGDKDWLDEFVVDLYFDRRYGTIMFETVGGRSSCPTEPNTLPVEDPIVELITPASPFIFPDDTMVMEISIANVGQAYAELLLEAVQGRGNLEIILDGREMSELGVPFTVAKDAVKRKQIAIKRGPLLYRYDPIQLTLKTCFGDIKDTAAKLKKMNSLTTLFNTYDENDNMIIEFAKPCPKIQWAGDLSRDRKFLVNTESRNKDYIQVKIFNTERITGTLYERAEGERLEHIWFRYRRIGDDEWIPGITIVDTILGTVGPMDFIALSTTESEHGYLTLDWLVNGVEDGNYEVVVFCQCTDNGGPDEMKEFSESVIKGAIDLTPPKQYGAVSPLRNNVVVGEEMVIHFTKPLDCGFPYTFDASLTIKFPEPGESMILRKEDLQLTCENRQIGIQLDLDLLDITSPADLFGVNFEVQIGKIESSSRSKVMDVHGNALLGDVVVFEKTFASIDQNDASVEFQATFDMTCNDQTNDSEYQSALANFLGLGIEAGRITMITSAQCHQGSSQAIVRAIIGPPATVTSDGGRKLRLMSNIAENEQDTTNSLELIRRLKGAVNRNVNSEDRSVMQIRGNTVLMPNSVKLVGILPGVSSAKRYSLDREESDGPGGRLLHTHDSGEKANGSRKRLQGTSNDSDVLMKNIEKAVERNQKAIEKSIEEAVERNQKAIEESETRTRLMLLIFSSALLVGAGLLFFARM